MVLIFRESRYFVSRFLIFRESNAYADPETGRHPLEDHQ